MRFCYCIFEKKKKNLKKRSMEIRPHWLLLTINHINAIINSRQSSVDRNLKCKKDKKSYNTDHSDPFLSVCLARIPGIVVDFGKKKHLK